MASRHLHFHCTFSLRGHTIETVEAVRYDIHLGDIVRFVGVKDRDKSGLGELRKLSQHGTTAPRAASFSPSP